MVYARAVARKPDFETQERDRQRVEEELTHNERAEFEKPFPRKGFAVLERP
jgi:hypothetical protein